MTGGGSTTEGMGGNVLIVFVKEPRPGAVKTRLLPALDPESAAELYRALAEEEIRQTAPRGGEYTRLFFYAPPSSPEAECIRALVAASLTSSLATSWAGDSVPTTREIRRRASAIWSGLPSRRRRTRTSSGVLMAALGLL